MSVRPSFGSDSERRAKAFSAAKLVATLLGFSHQHRAMTQLAKRLACQTEPNQTNPIQYSTEAEVSEQASKQQQPTERAI